MPRLKFENVELEFAARLEKRGVPSWLVETLAAERQAAAEIVDPVERRLAQLDLDDKEARIALEMLETGQ